MCFFTFTDSNADSLLIHQISKNDFKLFAEVDRLLQIYGENRSVRRYFEVFLDAARMSLGSDGELEPRYSTAAYELPTGPSSRHRPKSR